MATHKLSSAPLQLEPAYSTAEAAAESDKPQQELLGRYNTSVLVILSHRKNESETTQVVDEEIRNGLSLFASDGYCAPYDVRTAVVLRDQCLKSLIAQYNPSIVVTTGAHFMRLLLGGCAGNPSQYLQSLQSLHGQLIPAHQEWGSRMVYPLEDCDHLDMRRRDSSCSEDRKWSIRNDLRNLFAHLRGSASPRQAGAASASLKASSAAAALPMLWSSVIEAAISV